MKSSEILQETEKKTSPEESNTKIWRFEDVEIDVVRGRLIYGGEERKLRQKAFAVLVYLIEHRLRPHRREIVLQFFGATSPN